jgi:hypothetical protein
VTTPHGDGDCPRRGEALEVTEIDSGLVIYQDAPPRAHHLNNTAALIFELTDGTRSVEDIAAFIGETFALAAPPIDEVEACVDGLRQQGVLQPRHRAP